MGSSVPAAAGDFGFTLQPAKIGDGGTFTPASYTWTRSEAVSARIDLIDGDNILPPEVSPIISPKGAYKDGYFGAGQADILPRMQMALGVLLFGLMGAVSSVTGKDADGNAVSGVNTHIFKFGTSSYTIPWMAFRRRIPSANAASDLIDNIFDAKLTNMRITVPSRGKVATRITMVGRDIVQTENTVLTWANNYEDPTAIPESGAGFLKVAGTEYPITGAVIEFDNGVSTPNQERVVGSFTPDDFIPLYRTATIRFVYKWSDDSLYKLIRNNGTGLAWSNLPHLFDTVGNVRGFELSVPSAKMITGTTPYDFRIRANSVTLAVDGPIELAGGTLLQQAFTATVLIPTDGSSYIDFVLVNGQSSYAFVYTV